MLLRVGFALGWLAVGGALVSCSKSGDEPAVYRARALLQVMPDEGAEAAARTAYIATQTELARGREVLERVAEQLGLGAKWQLAEQREVVARLAAMVSSSRVGDSDLVEIAVESEEPQEAADIANAAAQSFVALRSEQELSDAKRALELLEEERAAQEQKVEESRKRMLELMENNKIIDLGADLKLRDDAGPAADIAKLKAVLGALEELEGPDLIRAAAELGGHGVTLPDNYPDYLNLAITERALLEGGLGTQHPKVLMTKRKREELERLLIEAVEESKRMLEARIEIAENELAAAERRQAERAAVAANAQAKHVEYSERKSDYELDRERLRAVAGRLEVFRIDRGAVGAPVELVERAVAPVEPLARDDRRANNR